MTLVEMLNGRCIISLKFTLRLQMQCNVALRGANTTAYYYYYSLLRRKAAQKSQL